jgi:hypothetical protein
LPGRKGIGTHLMVLRIRRHCEEQSDEAIHACFAARWIASLCSQ